MEERDRSRSPSRRTSRVEKVVGRWLRRSRESTSRERVLEDTGSQDQRNSPLRVTVNIPFEPKLKSHGFTVSTHAPPQVLDVTQGGPADGKLVTGDQLFKINDVTVDDLSPEQSADIIRECHDSILLTILRSTVGPKSSFITPEKRAKLKSNPVKVRFAEEVVVNGHSQGNSLLFLPNVLKVYLENGQTKAFKFEPNTTVKDIVLTLKEKLSIHCIAHFSLVLEQQHSISKLFLLHEDQTIQEVVEKKETQYYRCLFRVCFLPTDFTLLLREDPVAFEYLYLQSVNDVLQERFAVEMKCNMALRLAALHVQERLVSTGQSLKTPLKAVVKEWGIESFVSHTLLRNMREKDLKKAISYHMKKILSQECKPKVVSVNQARLNYMIELSALKSYGGKAFSATMMLQDRESMVSLLVGAQYGVSQVINHKLSIMTSLTHFNCITRVELVPESERVSLVKIYLQDIKPITLLMESGAAKDLSCLVSGYCKLLVDRQICVFPWPAESKSHRISSEEGYVSHCGSDCEDSDSDVDALLAHVASTAESNRTTKNAENVRKIQKEVEEKNIVTNVVEKHLEEETGLKNNKEMKENDEESSWSEQPETEKKPECVIIIDEPSSETSDSFPTDSHFITSMSSDSMDALEEDEFMINCSERRPCHLPLNNMCEPSIIPETIPNQNDFSALSGMADCLPSPPEASEDDCEEQMIERAQHQEDSPPHCPSSAQTIPEDYVFTFQQEDPRHYYNICSGVTPDSARSPLQPLSSPDQMDVPIFQPPPGFGDSSSDDEFFDAQDRFASPEEPTSATLTKDCCIESCSLLKTLNLKEIDLCFSKQKSVSGVLKKSDEQETFLTHDITTLLKRSKKRRSFMETYYTSLVSFPGQDQLDTNCENRVLVSHDSNGITCYDATCMAKGICPTVSSLTHFEGEPTELESKSVNTSKSTHKSTHNAADTDMPSKSFQHKQQLMEMEPDSMEFKSVTEIMSAVLPTIVAVRSHVDQPDQEISHSYGGDDMEEGAVGGGADSLLQSLFFDVSGEKHQGELLSGQADDQVTEDGLCPETLSKKSSSLPIPGQVFQSGAAWFQIPTILYNASSDLNSEKDSRVEVEPGVDKHSRSQDILAENVKDVPFQSRHFLSEREDDRLPNETDSDETDSLCDSSFQEPSSAVSSQGFLLTPCSSSILGRLSASTLRGKIHNLPLYLSRSQEFQTTHTSSSADTSRHTEAQLSSADFEEAEEAKEVVTFNEGASEVTQVKMVTIISEEMTEVIEELQELKTNQKPTESSFGHQLEVIPSSLVVTTKTPNGPWALVGGHHSTTNIFTCHQSQPTTIQPQSLTDPNTHQKQDLNCSSVMTLGCDIEMEDVRTPLEVCQTVYASCFSGVLDSTSFDDELTVYAFSQQSKQDGSMSLLSVSPFSSPLTSFPQLLLPASPSMELSPLLSPLETPDCVLSDHREDIIAALLTRQYPLPPMGFLCLQRDVDVLLALLTVASNALEVPEHPSDSCVNNFSENKRQLHMEARGLLAGCQRVIRVGQTEKQTLQSLSESFHSLVQLSSLCLCFSSCQRCAERHTQVRTRLVDVTKMYRDFVQAAESATNKKTYQDFGIKLLACRCTALTTSVFCLTQLFRTLTAL